MAKRRRTWSQSRYEEYVKAGRGQGEGASYKPWISVQSFSSNGVATRIFGYKTRRVHHLLSRNELNYFYLLEWSDKVLDIREQFPLLDIKLAAGIASKAGIKYPRDNISGFPYVLTCDFMITTKSGLKARTIKNTKDLYNPRTLEKLEIERRYWKERNVEWYVVTENEIPIEKAKNIEWVYTSAELPEYLMAPVYHEAILSRLTDQPLKYAAEWFDRNYGFPSGTGLRLIKHMLWTKQLSFEDTALGDMR